MLAEDLSDYLYVRTTGHIGSLMELIRRDSAPRAIRTGAETSKCKLLHAVKIDSADLGGSCSDESLPQPGRHHGRTAGRAASARQFGDR